ncbi:hypothetical protein TSAR_016647, partial [Trichomalopsis sarcophagae]
RIEPYVTFQFAQNPVIETNDHITLYPRRFPGQTMKVLRIDSGGNTIAIIISGTNLFASCELLLFFFSFCYWKKEEEDEHNAEGKGGRGKNMTRANDFRGYCGKLVADVDEGVRQKGIPSPNLRSTAVFLDKAKRQFSGHPSTREDPYRPFELISSAGARATAMQEKIREVSG